MKHALAVAVALVCAATAYSYAGEIERNLVGSVQLNYMRVPTDDIARRQALDGSTVELSLKLLVDFGDKMSSDVKVCVACHGMEVGLASFNLRISDQLNFRVGRFTPAFGEFPLRHDPANHRTSDKPLPYDMGRMLRISEWNMSVLPAPWVDNGLEVNGTQFFGDNVVVDYAVYAVGGPRAGRNALDFDYKQSRSAESYYVDNNSSPTVGGQVVLGFLSSDFVMQLGASAMRGTYDPDNELDFELVGAHLSMSLAQVFLRAEYLGRRTKMFISDDPASQLRYGPGPDGKFDPYFVKEGFYTELEVPFGRRVHFVARWDGMQRRGNVAKTSQMRSDSAVLRYTAGMTVLIRDGLRLKVSAEHYDFSDFQDEAVVHVGIAGPF